MGVGDPRAAKARQAGAAARRGRCAGTVAGRDRPDRCPSVAQAGRGRRGRHRRRARADPRLIARLGDSADGGAAQSELVKLTARDLGAKPRRWQTWWEKHRDDEWAEWLFERARAQDAGDSRRRGGGASRALRRVLGYHSTFPAPSGRTPACAGRPGGTRPWPKTAGSRWRKGSGFGPRASGLSQRARVSVSVFEFVFEGGLREREAC